MPRKKVYGKRSRAIYDPFQAFASPQRPTPNSNIRDQGVFVAEVVEELSRLKIDERKDVVRRDGRKALGEKSANESIEPAKRVVNGGKTKARRRKVVEDESEDSETARSREDEKSSMISRRQRSKNSPAARPESPAKREEDFVADNVPLFIDGHGYETGDEEVPIKPQTPSPIDQTSSARSKETSKDASTPSISILPPTPPAEPDIHSTHCSSLLSLSTHPNITPFAEWTNQLTPHFTITKIAEASFGEVYRLSLLENLSSFSRSDESVLKIIALKPPETEGVRRTKKEKEKVEAMSKVDDVANEVKLLQRLRSIPGFTNFRDVRLLQGRPPLPFQKAFRDFNTEQKARKKDPSVFPDPAKKTSYSEEQLWAVIEMQDAGTDLERLVEEGTCHGIWTVWDVFWQVVLALAKGEEGAEFEHRDLHLGNVCVRGTAPDQKDKMDGVIDVKRKLGFTGLEATVIDYTISRALLSTHTNDIAFHDLATPSAQSIFEGDSTEEYQYDIYRYMRGCVLHSDPYWNPPPTTSTLPTSPSPAFPSAWKQFHPRTNLLWLHHTLHALLEQLHWPSSTKAPARKLRGGKDFAVWKRANDLEHVLLRVQELLDPAEICGQEGLGSTGALVGLALEEGWLDVEDVAGHDEGENEESEGIEDLEAKEAKAVGEGETLVPVKVEKVAIELPKGGGRSKRKKQ